MTQHPVYPPRPPGRLHHATRVTLDGETYLEPVTLAFDKAPRCDARTRDGSPCLNPARLNGRCRMHGGNSTGATDPAKLAKAMRSAAARRALDHGTADTVAAALTALRGLLVIRLARIADNPDTLDAAELAKIQRSLAGVEKVAKERGHRLQPSANAAADQADTLRANLAERLQRMISPSTGNADGSSETPSSGVPPP